MIPSETLCKASLAIRNELADVYPLAIIMKQLIRSLNYQFLAKEIDSNKKG
jgi:hypothetical protein